MPFEISNPCAILFGAGATRGAFEDRSSPPPVDKDFFELAGQIEGRGTRAVARKVLKSVWELYGRTNNVGLEEYYREVETRARIGSFAKSQNQPRDWDRRKKDLEELIRRVYIHTTVDMTQTPPRPLTSPVHQHLLKRLRSGSTVITFNYDLVIEESFEGAELWNPGDGFAIEVIGISHDWTRQWLASRGGASRRRSKVHLLKLHGSLGWVQYANRHVRLKDRPYVVRKGVTEKISVCPPGWNKPIHRNPYKALWREARLKLESCRSLVIVGYSLPETDLLARALFSEVVRMRSARKNYLSHLVLVDPSDVVKERFTSLFTPALGPYGRIARYRSLKEVGKALGVEEGG
jgi:hypothetical protein